MIFTASGVMLPPRGRSTTATTTGTTAPLGPACTIELTPTAAELPRINASTTISSDRALMEHLVSLYFKFQSAPGAEAGEYRGP